MSYTARVNHITRLERITAGKMEPYLDGSYAERTFEGNAWRCDECGLVWDRRRFADSCAERKHKPSFEEGPYGVKYVLNGVPQGNIHYYPRQALRRDPVNVVVDLPPLPFI